MKTENEKFYDEQIAPVLLELARKCKERGMAFLASVEYDPLTMGRGRTDYMPVDEADKLSAAQRIVHWAARCDGNIDKFFVACDLHGKEHGHSSIYLQLAGNKNIKYTGNEVAAIAVITPPSS